MVIKKPFLELPKRRRKVNLFLLEFVFFFYRNESLVGIILDLSLSQKDTQKRERMCVWTLVEEKSTVASKQDTLKMGGLEWWWWGEDIKELSDGWTERIAGHVRRRVSLFPPLWVFPSFQTRLWLGRRRRSGNEANKRPPLRLDDDESWWWSNAHRGRLYVTAAFVRVWNVEVCLFLSFFLSFFGTSSKAVWIKRREERETPPSLSCCSRMPVG